MTRRMILITALLALMAAWAGAQDIINGVISTTESTNAESTVDDTTAGDVNEFGADNVIDFIYVNFDEEGVQVSIDGELDFGNSLITYIDNGTNTGSVSDFNALRGYTGAWNRNVVVNNANLPDFFVAAYQGATPALWQVLDDAALDQAALPVAIRALMERERVFACLVEGRRFDCGSKLGFLEAQFAYAQKRGELWSGLRQSLGDLLAHADAPPPAAAAMLTASAATASTEPARDS